MAFTGDRSSGSARALPPGGCGAVALCRAFGPTLRRPARLSGLRAAKHPGAGRPRLQRQCRRSEEHTSELQSLMRISYAVFCLKKKKRTTVKKTPCEYCDQLKENIR